MDFKDNRKLMQNEGKIQRGLIFLVILNIIVLVSVVVLSNLAYAQREELHQKTLYELTKHPSSTQIPHITVGKGPSALGVTVDKVYVANKDDNTVSVIDGKNNTKIGDIKVGNGPAAIGFDPFLDTIYVANSGDDTVSVIDEKANKVVAKVMFNTEPFNAGHIECDKDKLIAPIAQQFYLWSGSQCTAKPNQGFEFVSWQEKLGGNSTQLLQFSPPPISFGFYFRFYTYEA